METQTKKSTKKGGILSSLLSLFSQKQENVIEEHEQPPFSSGEPDSDKDDDYKQQIAKLSKSFEILEMTTKSVNSEAINTKNYLNSEMRRIQHRFFCVIDSLPDIVIVKDVQDRWKTANKKAQEIFGFEEVADYYHKTNQEIVDTVPHLKYKDTMLNSGIHDSDVIKLYLRSIREKQCKKEKYKMSFRSADTMYIVDDVTGEEKETHLDCVRTIIEGDIESGNETEMIIVGRDVTDIILSDQKNRLCSKALNSASDIIFFIDDKGTITFCNDKFLETFGYSDSKEVEGKPGSIIKSDNHDPAFFGDIWKSISQNKSWSGSIINKTTNGEEIEFDANFIPVMNGEPQPIFSICVLKRTKNQ